MWFVWWNWIFMGSADFLLTPALQRVLRVVYADPERCFTLNELLRVADTGKGSTQKQIDRLVSAGVLFEEPRRGRQRSLKANTDFFLYPELLGITRKSFGLVEPLFDVLAPFSESITEAFVFGSVATQTDSHRSDIDLMVIGTPDFLELSERLLVTEQQLARPIHLNLYSPSEWDTLRKSDPVLSQIVAKDRLEIISNAKTRRV